MKEAVVQPKNWHEYWAQLAKVREALRWLWALIDKTNRRRLFLLVVPLILAQLIGNSLPRILASIVSSLTTHSGEQLMLGIIIMGACVLIFGPLVEWTYDTIREWFLGHIHYTLDVSIDAHLFEKSIGQLQRHADLFSQTKMEKGRGRILDLVSLIMFDAGGNLMGIFLAYLLLLSLSGVAFGIMTIVIVLYVSWSMYLNMCVARDCGPLEDEWREHQRIRAERRTLMERVKTSGREAEDRAFLRQRSEELMVKDRDFWLWFINQSVIRYFVATGGFCIVFGYGCYQVWTGVWEAALLIPLFLWTKQIRDMLWTISHIEHRLNYNLPTIMKMIETLSIEPDLRFPDNGIVLKPDEPLTIRFENVSYVYPQQIRDLHTSEDLEHPPAIQNVSFTIQPGEKIAIMGPSGGGKSTLMKLLLRFMDPTSGRITVNGHDLRDIDYPSYVRAIGYVPQHAKIFNDTVRYNITYALAPEERAAITDSELMAIAKRMRCEFGSRMTRQLDTIVGEGGVLLSGGEQQRLALTAIAVQKPRMVLIDEGTSSLDSTTEKYVQEGLAELLHEGISAFIIAHRLSTVRHITTTFIVLKPQGELETNEPQIEAIARSFEELYALSPTFKNLADDQELMIIPRHKDASS